MSWNNQNNGGSPWGGKKSGPSGSRGPSPWGSPGQGGGGGEGPNGLDDLLRQGQDQLRSMMPGGPFSGRGVGMIVALAVVGCVGAVSDGNNPPI